MTRPSVMNTWIVPATPRDPSAHQYSAPGGIRRVFDTSNVGLVPVAFGLDKSGSNDFTLKHPPAGQVWAEVDPIGLVS
jgi:hypothetical protein